MSNLQKEYSTINIHSMNRNSISYIEKNIQLRVTYEIINHIKNNIDKTFYCYCYDQFDIIDDVLRTLGYNYNYSEENIKDDCGNILDDLVIISINIIK